MQNLVPTINIWSNAFPKTNLINKIYKEMVKKYKFNLYMKVEEIEKIIKKGESQNLEFKEFLLFQILMEELF